MDLLDRTVSSTAAKHHIGVESIIHTLGATNRTLAATLTGARDAIQSVAWSADGRWLAAGEFRRVLLYDAKTLQPFGTLDKPLTGRATGTFVCPSAAIALYSRST